jgi:hypothetical protein
LIIKNHAIIYERKGNLTNTYFSRFWDFSPLHPETQADTTHQDRECCSQHCRRHCSNFVGNISFQVMNSERFVFSMQSFRRSHVRRPGRPKCFEVILRPEKLFISSKARIRYITHHPILLNIAECQLPVTQLIHKFLEYSEVHFSIYGRVEEN